MKYKERIIPNDRIILTVSHIPISLPSRTVYYRTEAVLALEISPRLSVPELTLL